jgi:hypothetical protein
LYLKPNLVEAMEKRATIHFQRNEFEECLIECEEILKLKKSTEITDLMKKAKKETSTQKR